MPKNNKIVYTDNDRALVNALRGSEGMTIAELKEATGLDIKSGHIVSAMKKGLIAKTGERDIERPTTRKVSTYHYNDSDIHNAENGKPFNYTDKEKEILNALSTCAGMEVDFTLAELAQIMNLEKMSSGSINGLVKKGNLSKGGEREIDAFTKSTVGVYGFVADIPADAE